MRKKTLTREDLFCEPNFDELRDIAVDPSTGLQRLLSHEQLESVREEGEFEVDSREFANQVYQITHFFFMFGKTSKTRFYKLPAARFIQKNLKIL